MKCFVVAGVSFFFFLIIKTVEVSLVKRAKNFEANKVKGVAEVVGYERSEHSSWYTLLVRIPALNDGKVYNCDSAKINPGDYPKGTMVDVEYAHKNVLGIDAVEIRMIQKKPMDTSKVERVFQVLSCFMIIVFVLTVITGISTYLN